MATVRDPSQRRLVLLGDSILDNIWYTRPAPDTATLLRGLLGAEWEVDLRAEDGAVMADVEAQLRGMGRPDIAVLSVGGNDCTPLIDELARDHGGTAGTLLWLDGVAQRFGREYLDVARRVAVAVPRLVCCTIYEVRLEPPPLADLARVPIALLNDRIVHAARAVGAEVLELREVCTEDADYTLMIEPSAQGAEKIARAIASAVAAVAPG